MFLWLRVAIPVLASYFAKHECQCRIGIRKDIPESLQEYFHLEPEHTGWDHFVGYREYILFYLDATSYAPLDVSHLFNCMYDTTQ